MFLAIEIGGTKLQLVAASSPIQICQRRRFAVNPAAGADGIIIEVHVNPEEALSDKEQALTPEGFGALMEKIRPLHEFVSRL